MLPNVFSERKLFTFSFDGEKKWFDGTTIWARKKKFAFLFQVSKVLWKNVFCFDEDKDARKRARDWSEYLRDIEERWTHHRK